MVAIFSESFTEIYLVSSKLLAPFLGYLTLHSHVPHNHVVLHMFSLTFASKPCDIKSESQPRTSLISDYNQFIFFYHVSCFAHQYCISMLYNERIQHKGIKTQTPRKFQITFCIIYQNVRVNVNAPMKSFCFNKIICLLSQSKYNLPYMHIINNSGKGL